MTPQSYVIFAPSYDEHFGGNMVLHRLCHLLNEMGENAVLLPYIYFPMPVISDSWFIKLIKKYLFRCIATYRFLKHSKEYKVNRNWHTPTIKLWQLISYKFHKQAIIVYPEIIDGNPAQFKKVSRLLMHNPGHFSGKVNFGKNEILFRYSSNFARGFIPPSGSKISKYFITPAFIPEFFNPYPKQARQGTAYCIRKGKGKKIIHDLNDSILVDDLSLQETANIFRRVERFISYDPMTALSGLALLCHCPSYIILEKNEMTENYRLDERANRVYAYDLNDHTIDWDKSFQYQEKIASKVNENAIMSTKMFIKETKEFFSNNLS